MSDGDTSRELLVLAQRGDRPAYAELVRRELAFAYSLAWARAGSQDGAARAAEDAFVTAYDSLWMAPPRRFRPWLAQHVRLRVPEHPPLRGSLAPGDAIPAFVAMPGAARECTALYVTGLSLHEISQALEMKPDDVNAAIACLGAQPPGTPLLCKAASRLPLMLDEASLPYRQRAMMDFHTSTCEHCGKTLERLGRRLSDLRLAAAVAMPGERSVDRVLARLPAKLPVPPQLPASLKLIGYGWLIAVLAVIVGVVLLFLR